MTTISTLSKIPWQEGFILGMGIVAPSGQPKGFAVQDFSVADSPVRTENKEFHVISTENQMEQILDFSVSADFNIYGIKGAFDSSFSSAISYGRKSLTYVAKFDVSWQPSVFKSLPQLKPEADALTPEELRNRYGDYFIGGYRKAARFYAVYKCTAKTESSLASFRTTVSGGKPDVFTAKGSASFLKACTGSEVNIDCLILLDGVSGETSESFDVEPNVVSQQFEDFRSRMVGVPAKALLYHYSMIKPTIPAKIDTDPDIMSLAALIYKKLSFAQATINDIDPNYRDTMSNRLTCIQNDVQYKIPINLDMKPETLVAIHNEINQWLSDEEEIAEYEKFFGMVKNCDKSSVGGDNDNTNYWKVGYVTYAGPYVFVEPVHSDRSQQDWHIGWRKWTPAWNDPKYRIVGFEVFANWHDGTDGNWHKTSGDVLESHIEFAINSCYDRGLDWSIKIYAVKAAKFLFD
jgi:hypothetical protein